jgi:arylsulfatase A-like enzyme
MAFTYRSSLRYVSSVSSVNDSIQQLPGFDHLYPDTKEQKKNARKKANLLPKCEANRNARFCLLTERSKKGSGGATRIYDRGISAHAKYRTMVSAMDRSIGRVLRKLQDLGIEENTLVVFTSDNGPEDAMGIGNTGSALPYKGCKRYLYEGGLRVPTIWQWVGHIPAGGNISTFGVSTDLVPTFLHAAGVAQPSNLYLDGVSLLPVLIGQKEVADFPAALDTGAGTSLLGTTTSDKNNKKKKQRTKPRKAWYSSPKSEARKSTTTASSSSSESMRRFLSSEADPTRMQNGSSVTTSVLFYPSSASAGSTLSPVVVSSGDRIILWHSK